MPSRSIIRTGVGPHREPRNRFPAMAAAINRLAARAARVQSRRNLSRSLSPKLDHSHSITRFDRSRTGPNPALGAAPDPLGAPRGTSILSETPEIYGAEHLLTRRAATPAIGEKLVDRIRWWDDYTARNGGEMNNNPSPGNKAGGLTTILEKSLGAIAKGGQSTLRAVYEYAELVRERGFVFMDTPGYDPVAATGQVAGGANVIAFTTGRGSAFGAKPAPSIKLATNSDIFSRMRDDMDIDCGDILEGVPVEAKGQEIFDTILRVASGARTKSEELGYGDTEFVPWQIGAVM